MHLSYARQITHSHQTLLTGTLILYLFARHMHRVRSSALKKISGSQPAPITFIHRAITRAQRHGNETGSSLKIGNTSSMACQGWGFSGALTHTQTHTHIQPWHRADSFFLLQEQNTVAMHLKSAICLSCQPAVIFINNSKNILWNSFCFQIRSCDSFGTREHWVNCNALTCQWMGLSKVQLVMNWYLLRSKQAQDTTYPPSSVLSAMTDASERQRRSRRDELKLTTKWLQADCFNQAAKEVAFCIPYCGFILLLYT